MNQNLYKNTYQNCSNNEDFDLHFIFNEPPSDSYAGKPQNSPNYSEDSGNFDNFSENFDLFEYLADDQSPDSNPGKPSETTSGALEPENLYEEYGEIVQDIISTKSSSDSYPRSSISVYEETPDVYGGKPSYSEFSEKTAFSENLDNSYGGSVSDFFEESPDAYPGNPTFPESFPESYAPKASFTKKKPTTTVEKPTPTHEEFFPRLRPGPKPAILDDDLTPTQLQKRNERRTQNNQSARKYRQTMKHKLEDMQAKYIAACNKIKQLKQATACTMCRKRNQMAKMENEAKRGRFEKNENFMFKSVL